MTGPILNAGKSKTKYKGAVLFTINKFEGGKIYSNGMDLMWLLESKDTNFVAKSFLGLLMRYVEKIICIYDNDNNTCFQCHK